MSYLDFPRIHFTGEFQAVPSTVNNAPLNYQQAIDPHVEPWKLDSWWNAYGNGIYSLSDCTVSSAQVALGKADPAIVGQQVFAAYTSSPPKIADLDPMQQNVSEWWGLTVQVGLGGSNGKLVGNFTPVAFNNIWAASNGQIYGAAAGAGVYQSTLTNVSIEPGNSVVLQQLASTLPAAQNALSIRIQVSAYNGVDTTYDLSASNLATLRTGPLAPIPDEVWKNLAPISHYQQGPQVSNNKPGLIVATQFLNFLLQRWLGQAPATHWSDLIRRATKQSQPSALSTAFSYGKLRGTIGPSAVSEPRFFTAQRMLAPASGAKATGNFAPFQVSNGVLSIDLCNALQTQNPSDGPFQSYGNLTVRYADGTALSHGTIPYTDFATFLAGAGIFNLKLQTDDVTKAANTALAVYYDQPLPAAALLAENASGMWMRADQFVFRMNPGVPVTDPHLCSDHASLSVYVRQFGAAPPDGTVKVKLTMLSPAQSLTYTNSTIGTGGTPGLDQIPMATPAEAVTFPNTVAVNGGVARFNLNAKNPGNPRKFIDGQISFLAYTFDSPVPNYKQGPDDLVSLLVFEHTVVKGAPTWANSVGAILSQYGQLYPIMSRFGLTSHEQVKANAQQIADVLKRSLSDPFHMPVTRDLSESRRQIILKWMSSGMP